MIGLLADISDMFVTGVRRRIIKVDRLRPLSDEADQTFLETQHHVTNRRLGKALGSHQYQGCIGRPDLCARNQVDGAHRHIKAVAHAPHNGLKRRVQVTRSTNLADNTAQGFENHPPPPSRSRSASQTLMGVSAEGKTSGANSCSAMS